jgi:hypothetical protein
MPAALLFVKGLQMRNPRILRTVLAAAALVAFIMPVRLTRAASTAFVFSADKQSVCAGDTVSLNVKIRPGTSVAGFRLRVSFDDSVLQFTGTTASDQIEPGTLRTNENSNPVCSVYVCNVDKGCAPQLSETVLTYHFAVLGGIPTGTTNLCICVDQTCDFEGYDMALDTLQTFTMNLQPTPRQEEAYLIGLVPSEGALEPAFAQDVYDYRLEVDSEVKAVTFRTDAPDGCKVSVNRYTLYAAGSRTPILITVKSADGKAKSVYIVTVERAQKKAEETTSLSSSSGIKESKNSKAEKALADAKKSTRRTTNPSAKNITKTTARSTAGATEKSLFTEKSEHDAGEADGPALLAAAPLTIVESQMSPFLSGMLAAGFCIMVGIVLSLWFRGKKK